MRHLNALKIHTEKITKVDKKLLMVLIIKELKSKFQKRLLQN